MDFERISQLVDLLKQRTIVGDGDLPIIRDGHRSPIDLKSQEEYRRFLLENAALQERVRKHMTEEEIEVAGAQYRAWFQEYLRS